MRLGQQIWQVILIFCKYDRCELPRPKIARRGMRLMGLINLTATYIYVTNKLRITKYAKRNDDCPNHKM